MRRPSAGSGSQAQIWSARKCYRRSAHPRPNSAPRGDLPPSRRDVTCASWETPSVQGRLSLLDGPPEGAALHRSLETRSYFWWYAEQAVFGLMQAMRQLGNRTKSTDVAVGEVLSRTFLRIVKGSRNLMNFPRAPPVSESRQR